jgi:hypothetical protein
MSSPTRRLKCLAPRAGFAFSGPRAHLEVGRVDPSLDRPFDRARVRRFVVTELKAPPFRPEIADGLTVWLISGDGGRAAPALAGRTDRRLHPVPVEEPRARRVRPSRHDEAGGRRGRSQA